MGLHFTLPRNRFCAPPAPAALEAYKSAIDSLLKYTILLFNQPGCVHRDSFDAKPRRFGQKADFYGAHCLRGNSSWSPARQESSLP